MGRDHEGAAGPSGRRSLRWPKRSRDAIAREIDVELEFHLAARAGELEAAGISAEDARRRAVAEFGDLEATRAYCRALGERSERSMRMRELLSELAQDSRHAVRLLRRAPGAAVVMLLTLALGIGANTAIFSALKAVLLAPLPYADPGGLVAVTERLEGVPGERLPLSVPNYYDYASRQRSLAGVAAYVGGTLTHRPPQGDPQVVRVATVTANLFDVLGTRALHGRTPIQDDGVGAGRGVVVSHAFWRQSLGGDPAVVGQSIVLNDRAYDLLGIMPADFTLGSAEDIWLPSDFAEEMAAAERARKQHYLHVIGRLAEGVTLGAAVAELEALGGRLEEEHPDANAGRRPTLVALHAARTGDLRAPLLLLQGAAALVLLIACANIGNLTLARTIGRRHELSVRAALGGGRGRLARQLVTESMVIALAGGGLGVLVTVLGTRALLGLDGDVLPAMFSVRVDVRVLLFALALSALTGIASALLPALHVMRVAASGTLREGGRGSTGPRSGTRTRAALAVLQVALAVALLIGAGLLVQSFRQLTRVNIGFQPERVLTAQIGLGGPRYEDGAAINRFYDGVLEAVSTSPGVVAAGAAIAAPLRGVVGSTIAVEGQPFDATRPPEIGYVMVRGDYFAALRVPLVAGRLFDETDRADGPRTVLLNEAAVRRFLAGGAAIGRRIRMGPDQTGPWSTVVGIVGDVRDEGVDVPARPAVYVNHRQETWYRSLALVVRTSGEPAAAAPVLRRAVRTQDPGLALRDVAPLDDVLGDTLAPRRFALGLAACFAGLALLLAAIGVYGVLAVAVAHRAREFGVRRALGATAPEILGMVLRQGLRWAGLGLVLGLAGAAAGSRLLEGMLFGVTPLDAGTYAVVVLGAILVVGGACIGPALRATRVEPLTSMRA